jgi:hypothetical protein
MRAYKFLDQHFGLKNLYERRLKQSRLHDLNDPFDFLSCDLTEERFRSAITATLADLGERFGITCFSAAWRDPVIWAHYSDKHRGLCLGFELPARTSEPDKDITAPVTYISELVKSPSDFLALDDAVKVAFVRDLLFTKYKNWAYEEEIRMWNTLQNKDGQHYFLEFDETIRLVEIIVGLTCPVTSRTLARALGRHAKEVKFTKARRAYNKFEMVEDEGVF